MAVSEKLILFKHFDSINHKVKVVGPPSNHKLGATVAEW